MPSSPQSEWLEQFRKKRVINIFNPGRPRFPLEHPILVPDVKAVLCSGIWFNGQVSGVMMAAKLKQIRKYPEIEERLIRKVCTIIQLVGGSDSAAAIWWSRYMNGASFWYLLVTALLIIAFTYFYSSISFQPDEMAKNIQQQGGAVPSVRPGKPTADYLRRINGRLTLFAALFLAILATVPTVFTVGLQTQIPFAASSILIAVSVVLETKRQLDDLLVSRNYDSIS